MTSRFLLSALVVAQTRSAGQGWLYDWKDQKFLGLHQTHQPSPWIGDYGQFTVMATTGDVRFSEEERERGRIFGYTTRRFVRWNESAENRTKFRNWFVIQSDRPFTEVHLESGERKGVEGPRTFCAVHPAG